MAYEILKSDGTILLSLSDEQTLDFSGIKLIGKNVLNYGKDINENYIKIIENFAKNEPPANALLGQLWWDKTANALKVNSSPSEVANWKRISNTVSSNIEPPVKIIGDLWWDTNNSGRLRVWDGSTWVVIGPRAEDSEQTQTGVISDVIVDTTSASHLILKFIISDFLVAIFSRDSSFTPFTPITGFSTISRGLNISSQITDGGIRTRSIIFDSIGIKPLFSNVDLGDNVNTFRSVFASNFYGNASTSSTLQTSRKINGTDFDGSADITTAKWGQTRSISIGGTAKNVDGSANVAWSLSEIGLDTATKDESLVGQVATFARINAPTGWLPCDGRAVSRTTYARLFNAIGTLYGVGDGSSTFNLPDCRDEFFRGWNGTEDNVGVKFADSFKSHDHAATTASGGIHAHTASTNSTGAHSHGTTVSSDGSHRHSLQMHPANGSSGGCYGGHPQSGFSNPGQCPDQTESIRSAGSHIHTVTVNSAGSHSHTVSVDSGGSHDHMTTISSTGDTETRPRGIRFLVCIRH